MPTPRLTWPVLRARIEGPSMIPTLAPGEEVWVLRTRRIRPGDIVVFRDPRDREFILIKRVVRREPAGWWVEGEISGEHLPDSHTFGPVDPRLILGRVLRRR